MHVTDLLFWAALMVSSAACSAAVRYDRLTGAVPEHGQALCEDPHAPARPKEQVSAGGKQVLGDSAVI